MNYYAAAGLGYGVDVSHYGAPYQGMLGVDGLGQSTWTPGPGQTPADDPRMVKKYAVVKSLYRVRNVSSANASRLADLLVSRARALYPGNTVKKVGTTGWTRDGRVGFEVSLANATRAGEIKQRNAGARNVAAQIGGGAELYDAQTYISPSDYMPLQDTMLPPGEQPVASPQETPSAPARLGGLPIWAVAGIGVAALGAVAFVALRKKPVAANRTRRRSRRRMSRNGEPEFDTKAEAEKAAKELRATYKSLGYPPPDLRVVPDGKGWKITNDRLDALEAEQKKSRSGRRR
jgi:hypothetical protein